MARRLKNLRIHEVSTVDRGAGEGVRILLMKRDEPKKRLAVNKAVDALAASVGSILNDNAVVDKADALNETFDQFANYLAETGVVEKEDTSMPLPKTEEEFTKFVGDAVKAGVETALKASTAETAALKSEVALLKMSDAHKGYMDKAKLSADDKKKFADMSPAERDKHMAANPPEDEPDDVGKQIAKALEPIKAENEAMKKRLAESDLAAAIVAFEKKAVDMGLAKEDGETMRKAFGGDAVAQTALEKRFTEVKKAADEAIRVGRVFSSFGKANALPGSPEALLRAKADELRKADPKLTIDAAYVKAAELDPELFAKVRSEEMAKFVQ